MKGKDDEEKRKKKHLYNTYTIDIKHKQNCIVQPYTEINTTTTTREETA